MSQKNSLWVSSGYHYGDAKAKSLTEMTWGKAQNYTLGSGTSTQIFFQHQPDSSNWMIGFGFNFLIGNRNIVRTQGGPSDTFKTATATSNSLRMTLQLGYLWSYKKFNFQLNAGLIIPASTQLKGEISYRDSSKNSTETSVMKNYFSIGFKSSLHVTYKINRKIHFFVMLDQIILNSKVRKKTITGYQSSNSKTLTDIYPTTSDRETIYQKDVSNIRNNALLLPNAFRKDQATDQLSYSQSYSSIGLQLGIQKF